MRKFITLSLVAGLFISSLASACPGGNLIQVIDTDTAGNKLVIANYNISTGDIIFLNDSYRIVSVKVNRKTTDLCQNGDCTKLIDFKNKDIRVTYEDLAPEGEEEPRSSVVIKGVSVGGNVAVAKGIPRAVPAEKEAKDILGQTLFKCSKK